MIDTDALHPMNRDALSVRRERPKVAKVTAQHRPARFSHRNDDSIDRRSPARRRAEGSCATNKMLRKVIDDIARLEESIDQCIGPLAPGEGLHENDGGDDWWPDAVAPERRHQGDHLLALAREAADPARIENEQTQEARLSALILRTRRESASARATAAGVGSPTFLTRSSR